MDAYRLYSVDRTGKIVSVRRLDAECDEEAVQFASALHRDADCELWKDNTFIAAIPSMPEPAPSQPVR